MPGIIGFPQLDPGFVRPPEPEEKQQSTALPSWLPSYIYAYVNPPPPAPEPPDEDDQPAQPTVSPHDFADPPASSGRPVTQTTISIAEQIRRRNRKRAEQDAAAQNNRQPVLIPADILDINPDAVGSLEQQIAALYDGQSVAGSAQPIEQAPAQVASGYDTTPLTQLQEEQVDHLLSAETDTMAREVLLGLKREGMPSDAYISDFMSQYAEWGWDDLSSALAMQVLEIVRNSDWDEWLGHADSAPVETTAQDLGNDWIEGLVILDAKTGDTLLDVTGVELADSSQYVGLQDYEVEALKGLPLIFVHNHTKEVGASDEDLESAFDAGAEVLIVITPSGREQVYLRGRGQMVLVRDEQASYKVGQENPEETKELRTKSEEQAAVFEVDSPEFIFRQEEHYIVLRKNADLRLYEDLEGILRGNDASDVWLHTSNDFSFPVLDQNPAHPYAVKIQAAGNEFWIDLRDDTAEFKIERIEKVPSVYEGLRAPVSGQEYDNTSPYFLHSLREVQRNPQAIGLITVPGALRVYNDEEFDPNVDSPNAVLTVNPLHTFIVLKYSELNPSAALIDFGGAKYWIDTSNPGVEQSEEYLLQSIVGEDETVPVAISAPTYDASKIGLYSTDYNKISDIYKPFQVQSPVVGPDVRVEFVVTKESNTTTLGNYVVISFPASVYFENEEIMQRQSEALKDHLTEWGEDGRIFIAYGHLSEIHVDIYPGKIIDSQDEDIIGKTGNTGLRNPNDIDPITNEPRPYKNSECNHPNQHLDLAIAYFGSIKPGTMAALEATFGNDRGNANYFFWYVLRSTLSDDPDYPTTLYGENIDPDSIPRLFEVGSEPSR